MSEKTIAQSLKPPVDHALILIHRFILECPEDLWGAVTGGYTAWQHVAHAISAEDFFTPGESVPKPKNVTDDELHLKRTGTSAVSKDEITAYFEAVRKKVSGFIDSLEDKDLAAVNEATSKAVKLDWTIAHTLALLAAHPLYHLGYLDALLKNNGHKTIF
ncbi:MAG: DinB family protein [Deltaproteobacteria bacterium]|jgi:hypothetical protein|nr:DinB family protein [Deltaproteobacteria bacterium]